MKNINVFIISLCAMLGFTITFFFIQFNLINYSVPQKSISLQTNMYINNKVDSTKTFYLKVHSLLPIDSIANEFKASNKKIEADILYHQIPVFLVWLILICIMIAIAAGSIPLMLLQIVEMFEVFGFVRKEFLLALRYAFILTLFLSITNIHLDGYYKPYFIIDHFHILLRHGYVLPIIVVVTTVFISPAFVLIFIIGLFSNKININSKTTESIEIELRRIKFLNHALQNTLQLLAIIVVFSVLTSNLLGQSIRSVIKIEGFNIYPVEVSYVYGIYFSLFLSIIYFPAYYFIKHKYLRLKDSAYYFKSTESEDKWYGKLFSDTKFEASAIDNVKLALTVLSPLISSFLPFLNFK